MRYFSTLTLLILAACTTPQQACINKATKNLKVIDNLIAQTNDNLARGYAVKSEPHTTFGLNLCASPNDHVLFCTEPEVVLRDKPVAIDPRTERRKLAALKTKRSALLRQAKQEIRACQSAHPNG